MKKMMKERTKCMELIEMMVVMGKNRMIQLPEEEVKVMGLKEGDELAKRVVERFGRYLGTAISVMAGILDPEVIVIGGGVSKAGWILLDYIRRYYKPYAYKSSKETEFALAQLGNDAGIYGCAKLILD